MLAKQLSLDPSHRLFSVLSLSFTFPVTATRTRHAVKWLSGQTSTLALLLLYQAPDRGYHAEYAALLVAALRAVAQRDWRTWMLPPALARPLERHSLGRMHSLRGLLQLDWCRAHSYAEKQAAFRMALEGPWLGVVKNQMAGGERLLALWQPGADWQLNHCPLLPWACPPAMQGEMTATAMAEQRRTPLRPLSKWQAPGSPEKAFAKQASKTTKTQSFPCRAHLQRVSTKSLAASLSEPCAVSVSRVVARCPCQLPRWRELPPRLRGDAARLSRPNLARTATISFHLHQQAKPLPHPKRAPPPQPSAVGQKA
mmetsp:Transcript_29650/g.78570  ORF Transcript_29650/g.78570 Transcript_29650/m.78570 type:complete len:312 (+) Transcript_29650:34-969(+)